MHLFKSCKYSPTKVVATTTVGGGGGNDGEGGLSSSGNGEELAASTPARMKHKSMDMSFFPLSNFLALSISRKVASSPERVPRQNNEFDTPGFLSRSWSINKKLDRSLSRSKSVAKGGNGNVWEADAETKPSHRRSQSTTRKNDWFGSFVGGGRDDGLSRGKSGGEGSGSSRSKSTTARRSYAGDGGSGSSRSGRPEMDDKDGSESRSRRSESMSGPLPGGGSRRSSIPIMFSNSKGKPPPVERTLECSLEELLSGCVKKVLITRNVFGDGTISQKQETLRIKVKPGWKQGTKITFEGMGDEQPGMLPADIIFSVAETRHKLYRREGDDLVMAIEIPLVKALTGCNLSIPLLGGGTAGVRINEVIHPGYERVLLGDGMPSAKDKGARGNLCLRFHVAFPTCLSRQQRSELYSLLRDS